MRVVEKPVPTTGLWQLCILLRIIDSSRSSCHEPALPASHSTHSATTKAEQYRPAIRLSTKSLFIMSAPQGDGSGGYGYDQQPFQEQPADGPPQESASAPGKKKKRGYAAGAFDVGSGANAAVGGQVQGGGQFGMPQTAGQPGYGGYPAETQQPAQPAVEGSGYTQGYGQQQQPPPTQQPAYGYQAPDQGYQAPGAQPGHGPPGVGGITSGVGNMNINAQPQHQQQGQGARPAILNQLYPSDLLSQPFNVAELDLPPPPITLPPNVRSFLFNLYAISY